jgi:preprotein translocase subunit YajC
VYTLLPLVIILVAFWFLLIRPQQRRQAQLRALQSELTAGDEVMLSSGIFGTVVGSADDYVLVEVADGVTLKVVRGAIGRVLPKEPLAQPDAPLVEPADEPSGVDLSKPEED